MTEDSKKAFADLKSKLAGDPRILNTFKQGIDNQKKSVSEIRSRIGGQIPLGGFGSPPPNMATLKKQAQSRNESPSTTPSSDTQDDTRLYRSADNSPMKTSGGSMIHLTKSRPPRMTRKPSKNHLERMKSKGQSSTTDSPVDQDSSEDDEPTETTSIESKPELESLLKEATKIEPKRQQEEAPRINTVKVEPRIEAKVEKEPPKREEVVATTAANKTEPRATSQIRSEPPTTVVAAAANSNSNNTNPTTTQQIEPVGSIGGVSYANMVIGAVLSMLVLVILKLIFGL
eukprot:TRINITY_DN3133_c0_g2_i1.p1 TRINITY_DN3133_c0_g2~~TRINITY_DN3133_c0_g2_i1.p1  ORF type:complete len:287 (+),score=82.52 TRINITY_DN3133_c0_g2_i1:313-1173(+)